MDKQTIIELGQKISHLDYVVMRNWQRLPDKLGTEGHEDLDLFVSEKDRDELQSIIVKYDLVDLRSPRDNYYSESVQSYLLEERRVFNGFFIPNKRSYFLTLFYHANIHKKENVYGKELKQAFVDAYGAVECVDKGVGFNVW